MDLRTVHDLIAALTEYVSLDPVEQAKVANDLGVSAQRVLAVDRGRALQQAKLGGRTFTKLADDLGISRTQVHDAVRRYRDSTRPPTS